MHIFITGSSSLTKFDKLEIKNYLESYGMKHDIHVMCYRSLENEVLSFFIENDEYANQLHLYTFQPFDLLAEPLKQSIQYLKEIGSYYHSFGISDVLIKRSVYEKVWNTVLDEINLVMCFYNGDKPTALIPVDIAESKGIEAIIYRLPGFDSTKLELPIDKKIEFVEKKKGITN